MCVSTGSYKWQVFFKYYLPSFVKITAPFHLLLNVIWYLRGFIIHFISRHLKRFDLKHALNLIIAWVKCVCVYVYKGFLRYRWHSLICKTIHFDIGTFFWIPNIWRKKTANDPIDKFKTVLIIAFLTVFNDIKQE